jgi:prepilin-type N-terminal cleavage/methylation domain-containing protein/prepilin-type processing-associated H-X9-DG protein
VLLPQGRRSRRTPLRLGRRAFTLVEVLVVLGVVALLLAFLATVVDRARASQHNVICVANLRQIARALTLYARDNGSRLPDPEVTQVPWETALHDYVSSAAVFACPADEELYDAVGSSYDWRDLDDPLSTLAGADIAKVVREGYGERALVFDALPDWHRRGEINVAFVDGSVHSVSSHTWLRDLSLPVRAP